MCKIWVYIYSIGLWDPARNCHEIIKKGMSGPIFDVGGT